MTRAARALARYGLPDTDSVRANLAVAGLLVDDPADLQAQSVLRALSRAGRPELAARHLAGLVTALREQQTPATRHDPTEAAASAERARASGQVPDDPGAGPAGTLLRELRDNQDFRGRLLGLLGGSDTLGEHLVVHPQEWVALLEPALPARSTAAARFLQMLGAAVRAADGTVLPAARAVAPLRTAYRTELAVIAAADLAPAVEPGSAGPGLAAVSRALSDLADAVLAAALDVARAEHPGGTPARLAVVAMGKCGARELNYVSDVDVMFVAAGVGEAAESTDAQVPTDGGDADAGMIVTATAQATALMRICGQVAWEVDAGLRPEGGAGPLVRTLAGYAAYYQRWAKTWEFQALLKARPAAGDTALGHRFLQVTRPGVWAAADRESFVSDVQAMRRRVADAVPVAERDRELKLGAGGLRDVEFAVQLMQLVHGRVDTSLRAPNTLDALAALTAGGYVGRRDGTELADAYAFQRRVEHLLQLQHLRRTHTLPAGAADLDWLARADGYDAAGPLSAELSRHAATVRRLHEKLFYRPLLASVAAVPTDELRLTPQAAASRLRALGFAAPEPALQHIAAVTDGVSRRAAIQRTLLPVLLDTFADGPDPDAGLLAYRQVSDALAGTPWYLRLLRDEGLVAQRLAGLLGGSRLVADLLQRAPEVLRLLVHDADLVGPDPRAASAAAAAALLARAARAEGPTAAADSARSARRHEMLRLACADLLGLADTDVVMAGLTGVAGATVQAALAAAQRQVASERGGSGSAATMAVIGMGRFGGAEMGYSSDADVLFVAGPATPDADPQRVIVDATAIAEMTVRLLGRPSPDPPLRVDADLRPEGRSGPLVRTVASYRQYWQRRAQPWERQALLRARPVAGDEALAGDFVTAAAPTRYPPAGLAPAEVREIRRIKARVDAERLPRGADPTLHTKLGRGGLADVEWTVQLLQLRHAGAVGSLRVPGTLSAIRAAADSGLIDQDDATALAGGWRAATRARNAIMLVTGRPVDEIPAHGRALAGIAKACGYPAHVDPGEFVDDYRRATRRARRVVDRLFDRD